MPRRPVRPLLGLLCALALPGSPVVGIGVAAAQEREGPPRGGIGGAVLDARTDAPVAG
ncbi:MAG: hypothetical protein GWN71_34600, partial [Gammaproteobacteria bacterium]|nr:hypothetical protein [Gemmatimonadota bacterium]NIU78501.1 hypothetical protein [Gammaproteobacteria bacterium]NIY11758.1 hypothetical protein [Gemmatimonadota bacterium]